MNMKILISGASKGLGLCLVKEFLSRNDKVLAIARSPFKKENLTETDFDNFTYYQCDTTDNLQIKSAFHAMIKADFVPDICLFCAGSATEDIADNKFSVEKLKINFDLNYYGILYWIELLLPYFIKRGSGSFVGISSMSIYRESHKNRIGYAASKLALNKTFETLRMQYFKTGVTFSICTMGRILKTKGLIGIEYKKAACLIARKLKSQKPPDEFRLPILQEILTRISVWFPKKIYYRFFFK